MDEPLEGGCHCGAVRYRISAAPADRGYCHCRICQLTTGAPVAAWAAIPIAGFTFTQGMPKVYRSSSWGERLFCGQCGAQILYRETESPTWVSFNVTGLDDPAAMPPTHHIFREGRIAWFETADDLPRWDGAKDES